MPTCLQPHLRLARGTLHMIAGYPAALLHATEPLQAAATLLVAKGLHTLRCCLKTNAVAHQRHMLQLMPRPARIV